MRSYFSSNAASERNKLLRKILNAAKPSEQSKGLVGIRTLAVRTKNLVGTSGDAFEEV